MSNPSKTESIPPRIGLEPLDGSFYACECPSCGWVGSSEVLTDDCQCTQIINGNTCLAETDEVGSERLLGIIQSMATRHEGLTQSYARLNKRANEAEKGLIEGAELVAEIIKSEQAYRECTDKSSPTGVRASNLLRHAAQVEAYPAPAGQELGESEWAMHPCSKGHRDVGAAGGIAHCYVCSETVSAATTEEAFKEWNATHPAA